MSAAPLKGWPRLSRDWALPCTGLSFSELRAGLYPVAFNCPWRPFPVFITIHIAPLRFPSLHRRPSSAPAAPRARLQGGYCVPAMPAQRSRACGKCLAHVISPNLILRPRKARTAYLIQKTYTTANRDNCISSNAKRASNSSTLQSDLNCPNGPGPNCARARVSISRSRCHNSG